MGRPPSESVCDGHADRDGNGRFKVGNRASLGNSMARRTARLRSALVGAVSIGDIERIVAALVGQAAGGDVGAAKLILAHVLGRPVESDLLHRLESLEALAASVGHSMPETM